MTHLYDHAMIKKREQNVDVTSIPRSSSMQCRFRRFIANPLTSGSTKPTLEGGRGGESNQNCLCGKRLCNH